MQNETRPHTTGAPARFAERGSALWREDPDREALPITGRSWAAQMPYARLWPGSGGPRGERNGNYQDGLHTKQAKAAGVSVRKLMREARDLLQTIGGRRRD